MAKKHVKKLHKFILQRIHWNWTWRRWWISDRWQCHGTFLLRLRFVHRCLHRRCTVKHNSCSWEYTLLLMTTFFDVETLSGQSFFLGKFSSQLKWWNVGSEDETDYLLIAVAVDVDGVWGFPVKMRRTICTDKCVVRRGAGNCWKLTENRRVFHHVLVIFRATFIGSKVLFRKSGRRNNSAEDIRHQRCSKCSRLHWDCRIILHLMLWMADLQKWRAGSL